DVFTLNEVNAPADTLVTSNTIAVSGLASATDVANLIVTGAPESAYSINGAPFTALSGAVKNSDTVAVRHRAAATAGQTATTTLNIGGVTTDFVSTATAS